MKKLFFTLTTMAMLVFTACSNDDVNEVNDSMDVATTRLIDAQTGTKLVIKIQKELVVEPEWLAKEQLDFGGSERDAHFVFVGAIKYKGKTYVELYNMFLSSYPQMVRYYTLDGERMSDEFSLGISVAGGKGEVEHLRISSIEEINGEWELM